MRFTDFSTIPRSRIIVLLIALVTVVLSWTGNVDTFAEAYVDGALVSGGLVYATARGINALVSLLQGTEFSLVAVTFSVGEVLDPLNDLIERFSALMLLALGSLALQKILLQIFGHAGFSVLITLSALLLLVSSASRKAHYYSWALKFFAITVVLRFALGLVVVANAAVDHFFLTEGESANYDQMKSLQGELKQLSTAAPGAAGNAEIDAAEMELDVARSEMVALNGQIEALIYRQRELNLQLNKQREKMPLYCILPVCAESVEVLALRDQLEKTGQKKSELQGMASALNATIIDLEDYLACETNKREGKSCGFWDKSKTWVSPDAWLKRFDHLSEQMNNYATNIITLLVSLLAKTLLIPLFFLFTFIQLYRVGIRVLLK